MTEKNGFNDFQEKILNEHLPYRLTQLDGLCWACKIIQSDDGVSDLTISIGNKSVAYSRGTRLLTNALSEAGILYCRVLLSFLGINSVHEKLSQLNPKKNSRKDDFSIKNLNLPFIIPDDLLSASIHCCDDIEGACIRTLQAANKSVAHLTSNGIRSHTYDASCCAQAVMWAVEEFVYKKLDRTIPSYKYWTTNLSNGKKEAPDE